MYIIMYFIIMYILNNVYYRGRGGEGGRMNRNEKEP